MTRHPHSACPQCAEEHAEKDRLVLELQRLNKIWTELALTIKGLRKLDCPSHMGERITWAESDRISRDGP